MYLLLAINLFFALREGKKQVLMSSTLNIKRYASIDEYEYVKVYWHYWQFLS